MRLVSLLAVAALVGLTTGPAFAASDATDAFVANVRLNSNFLTEANTLATRNSKNQAIQQFAAREAGEQAEVLDTLKALQSPAGTIVPVETASADTMITGRSVALDDNDLTGFAQREGIGAVMPAAGLALGRLSATTDEAFDATYKAAETGALGKLEALYDAYSRTGDDPTLRELAARQLVKVRASLETIGKL